MPELEYHNSALSTWRNYCNDIIGIGSMYMQKKTQKFSGWHSVLHVYWA